VDHHGALRYVGSTVSTSQTFYERIHRRNLFILKAQLQLINTLGL
jgi:hypothetical protein